MSETTQSLHRQPSEVEENKIGPRLEIALWFALLVIPLTIGLVWGAHFDDGVGDGVYVTFRYARNLATGRGLTYDWGGGTQTPLRVPLYALTLALLAWLGIPLSQAGLVWSALGWGVAAIAIYCTGRAMREPIVAVVSAALLVFNPIVVSTLGTEIPWAVALAWIAIASSMEKRWDVQTIALALMLCVHLDLSTLTLAMLLMVVQWIERRRFPLRLCLVLAVVALGWVLATARQIATPILLPDLNLGEWGRGARQLLDESEFYWLFLPLFVCGGMELLAASRVRLRKTLGVGLLWGAWAVTSLLSGGLAAPATMVTLGLFLAGLGVKWIAARHLSRLDRFTLALSVALVAGVALGAAQASSLYQRYRFRPVVYQSLERQAGDWLRVHSEPTAIVLGSERVGYLADRPTFAWSGEQGDPAELAWLLKSLEGDPPDYCVSFESLAWDRLMRTGWFQDGYVPLQQFESPYDAASPVTVWRRRFRAFDWTDLGAQPLSVRLPGGVYLVGYKYQPERIQPGDVVRVTLFSQWTRPSSPHESFRPVVRIVSPNDGASWVQQGAVASRSVLMDSQRTGRVLADEFVLTPPDDIPTGAYHLDVSMAARRAGLFLPVYLNDDTVPFESVTLGYVVAPWRGQLDGMTVVDASFGDQITLLGFEAVDSASPGAELDVRLYWEAQRPPEDNYFVFIHLLDADGQLVTQHDGPPMDGRYPARAWFPGDVVPDVHRIVLGSETSAGTYRLQVGMYRWPSLERLPIWDSQGVEQPDGVIVLQTIKVR